MKKAYTKPEIVIEDFLLSEHIAACSGKDDFQNNVGISMDDLINFGHVFTQGDSACWMIAEDGGTGMWNNEFYCYFTSANGRTLFSS